MPLLSLNEAVTSLLGDAQRTPDAELAFFELPLRNLERLAAACREHWPFFRRASAIGFPGWIPEVPPSWPPQLVVEILGSVDDTWPTIRTLAMAAAECEQFFVDYNRSRTKAVQTLLREGREGNLRIYGRRHLRTRLVSILPRELTSEHSLDPTYRHLIIDARVRLSRGDDADRVADDTMYDAQVDDSDLAYLLSRAEHRNADKVRKRAASYPTDEEMLQWIHHPDQEWFRNLHGKDGHSRQERELKKNFEGLKNARKKLPKLNVLRPFRLRPGRQ